ncbi:MAG: ATP synthase F0 subunit C [Nitrospinota bacterium]|nr:ATP synthase F0 subunit C [Nitrospinota bacterium]
MNISRFLTLIAVAVVAVAPASFASEGGAASGSMSYMALGCVVGLGLAALGGGIGMGQAISGTLGAMARNPGFYSKLFPNFLIGMALIESLVIYTLVVVLILLYANPL